MLYLVRFVDFVQYDLWACYTLVLSPPQLSYVLLQLREHKTHEGDYQGSLYTYLMTASSS